MGSSSAPLSLTAAINKEPAATKASLFASKTRLPACAAAKADGRPAAPTIAAITTSVCASAAVSARACWPTRISGGRTPAGHAVLNTAAAWSVGTITTRALVCKACAASCSIRECAESAYTTKRSGCRAITSRVLSPIDPVEPSMVMRTGVKVSNLL